MNKENTIEWGQPVIDYSLCTDCGLCALVCSTWTIAMVDDRPVVQPRKSFNCIGCGQCMAVCSFDAVRVTGRRMKREDAFPLPAPSTRATADSLTALLEARRSTRHYADIPVEQATLDRLLTMASTAPMGFPPSDVGVVAINGRQRVQEFAHDICQAFEKWSFLGSPIGALWMRLFMDKATANMMKGLVLPVVAEILEGRKKGQDYLFYDAPCVILFHYPMKDTVDPTIVCSFAAIAAEALGLGSCMIGTVPPALQGDKKLKVKWGIPGEHYPSIAMILGHPAVKYSRGVRRRFASVKYV